MEVPYLTCDAGRHLVKVAINTVFINSESRMRHVYATLIIFKGRSRGICHMPFSGLLALLLFNFVVV